MLIKNLKASEIELALHNANKQYGGNLKFRKLEWAGWTKQHKPKYTVTITVESSKGPGHRMSFHGERRVTAACWHAYGDFIDSLFDVNREAEVRSKFVDEVMRSKDDNWQDKDVGSKIYPAYMSDLCECGR